MNIDIYLKINPDTGDVEVLDGSRQLYEAIEYYGVVVAYEVETRQPFEVYLEDNELKARPVTVSG